MEKIIGRSSEIIQLTEALASKEAELIAIYGRRRIGKTFLVRNVYKNEMVFEMTGLQLAGTRDQLRIFSRDLGQSMGLTVPLAVPIDWIEAFELLKQYVSPLLKDRKRKKVLFFDEFPWIHTHRSGFLQAFDHFWNSWAVKQDNLIVVICGSAASWMIRNIIKNKGGLHNRITHRIALMPFTLHETEAYLESRKINLNRYHILQLYMAMGGIPHYLKAIKTGETSTQAIDRLCFKQNGLLRDEFENLYNALFDHADRHLAVIRALAGKPSGLNRGEIIKICQLSSGGTTTKLLDELAESGFISRYIPFQKKQHDTLYKLSDEYSCFYLKFIENTKAGLHDAWTKKAASPTWRSWSGMAFENVCLKHTHQIKHALGISGVYTEESPWRYVPGKGEQGVQIDLLIDRQDFCINICEMKFSMDIFTIDKRYASDLQYKLSTFTEVTKTRKNIFLTLVTTFGVKNNEHKLNLVQQDVTMDALFSS